LDGREASACQPPGAGCCISLGWLAMRSDSSLASPTGGEWCSVLHARPRSHRCGSVRRLSARTAGRRLAACAPMRHVRAGVGGGHSAHGWSGCAAAAASAVGPDSNCPRAHRADRSGSPRACRRNPGNLGAFEHAGRIGVGRRTWRPRRRTRHRPVDAAGRPGVDSDRVPQGQRDDHWSGCDAREAHRGARSRGRARALRRSRR
jgi:hypothetical protein